MGHCIHGWKTKPNNHFEVNGKKIEINCPWCAAEDRKRRDDREYAQQADLNLVKTNLLYLLEHDRDFRNQVKYLLS